MSSLTVAAVELTSGEDVGANVEQILGIFSELKEPVDLICLPENSLYFRISKSKPIPAINLQDPHLQRLSGYARQHDVGIMVGSVPVLEDGKLANATVFLAPDQPAKVLYRKLHLFDVDVPGAPPVRESESFRHGAETALIDWRDWKIGLTICYDLRFPELFLEYGQAGADLILVPSAFLVPTGQAHWDILLRARAIENQCYVVAAAQSGEHRSGDETRATYGHSLIVGPWGEKIVELTGQRRLGIAKLSKDALKKVRKQIPMREHRQQRRWET